MKKLLLLTMLFMTSSLASPLIGSKTSFAQSSFCKKWKCQFVKTSPVINSTDKKLYDYTLPDGADISIGRNGDKTIGNSSIISYEGDALNNFTKGSSHPYINELLYDLTGLPFKIDAYQECISPYDNSNFFSGPDHKLGVYTVNCGIAHNPQGQPILLIALYKH